MFGGGTSNEVQEGVGREVEGPRTLVVSWSQVKKDLEAVGEQEPGFGCLKVQMPGRYSGIDIGWAVGDQELTGHSLRLVVGRAAGRGLEGWLGP